MIKLYREKYGICTIDFFDIDIIQWWKWYYYGTPSGVPLRTIPRLLYKDKQSIKKLCRYVIENEIGLKTRDSISQITTQQMRDYKISFDGFEEIKFSPYKLLTFCYPEYNYRQFELKHVPNDYWKDRNNWTEAIDFILDKNNLTLEDVTSGNSSDIMFSKFGALITTYFGSLSDLWIWYYGLKNIKLSYLDFATRPNGYWKSKENIIKETRNYCENICNESISLHLKDKNVEGLVGWIGEYFTVDMLAKHKLSNIKGYTEAFKLLELAYPEITSENLLFQWDFTGCKKWNSKKYRVKSLKELVLYRLKLKDLKNSIPKTLSRTSLSSLGYSKFATVRDKYYKNSINFYEWAIETFPEYKDDWSMESFGKVYIAFDGAKCNSNEERVLYEFIKNNLTSNIIALGYERDGEYVYKLPEYSQDNKYCPDFVIEGYGKPIIIEYFGMYNYSNTFDFAIEYNKKTHRKNIFFKRRDDIQYVDIYPSDLKDKFRGVLYKLSPLLRKV